MNNNEFTGRMLVVSDSLEEGNIEKAKEVMNDTVKEMLDEANWRR